MGQHEPFPIYCEDYLIPEYQKLFAVARQMKRDRRINHAEVRDCAIRVIVTEEANPIKVTMPEQLEDLVPPSAGIELMECAEPTPTTAESQGGGQKRDLETWSPDMRANLTTNVQSKKAKERYAMNIPANSLTNGTSHPPRATNGLNLSNTQRKMLQYFTQNTNMRSQLQSQPMHGTSLHLNTPAKPYSYPLKLSQLQPLLPQPQPPPQAPELK